MAADSKQPPQRPESDVEAIKRNSRGLRGDIGETLAGDATHFDKEGYQILKFHGIYQQDDRDTRSPRRDQGLEPDFFFMVRVAIPGGRLTSEQYLALDDLADECGDGSLRITTRQGIQYHCVAKGDLKPLIARVNEQLMTTLAACGDVSRNVMASPEPIADDAHRLVQRIAGEIARALRPQTSAYHEIWLGDERVVSTQDNEPFYGQQYLPRKFKAGVTLASDNNIDIYTYDAGLIAVVDDGEVRGFNVVAGGGMGMTHNKATTIATLAQPVGFVAPEHGTAAVRHIAGIFRDHGNRSDRRHARLKYLIQEWGIERFREEFRQRAEFDVAPPVELPRPQYQDYVGAHAQGDGRFYYGVFVQNGRVADRDGVQYRSAVRRVVEELGANVVLSANQNLLLTDLAEDQIADVERILREHGVKLVGDLSNIRRYSMACPALPTCGLALTESERAIPRVLDDFETLLADLGLDDEELTLRMTGCPNGCARPYTADIGFVGRKPGEKYSVYVGGGLPGDRVADLFADDIPIGELADTLRPLLTHFARTRQPDESLSDFYWRLSGKAEPRRALTGKETPVRESLALPVLP